MLTTLTDQILGEIHHMRYIDRFDVLVESKEVPSIRISQLPGNLKDKVLDLSNNSERYLETYSGYEMRPDETPDADRRLDVMVDMLVAFLLNADNDFMNEFHADGEVAGFISYSLYIQRDEKDSDKIFDFRGKLEEVLTDGDSSDFFTLFGEATGL